MDLESDILGKLASQTSPQGLRNMLSEDPNKG